MTPDATPARVLVTGGTGTLGRVVVQRLLDRGCRVRVLTRREHAATGDAGFVRGDLSTGGGIDAAVRDIDVVVHCAGSARGDDVKARTLMRAVARAHVHHVVNVSVVGAERVPVVSGIDRTFFGYFAMKRAAERVVSNADVPSTTLRATQFHDLLALVARQLARLPVVPVPAGFRFHPVDVRDIAERLTAVARVGDRGSRTWDAFLAERLRGRTASA